MSDEQIQLDWDVSKLHGRWPTGPDNAFIMNRLQSVAVDATAAGGTGRVLEVAAAEAIHSCRLNLRGLESFVLEPSPVMLELARGRVREYGARVTLVRGIAETLPFRDRAFDRVLCESAIDHFADPECGIGEMARVLKPDGRLVIGVVNYGGLNVRLSRLVYQAARRMGYASRGEHLFWDTPVPIEHSFECTYPALKRLCAPHLDLERAFGVSIGWMVPGWGPLLERLPAAGAVGILRTLDGAAYLMPRMADYILSVWRPRVSSAPARSFQRTLGPADRSRPSSAAAPSPPDNLPLTPGGVIYKAKIRAEAEYWGNSNFSAAAAIYEMLRGNEPFVNAAYTGNPDRSWLEDLIGRGPYRTAAALGCDESGCAAAWLSAAASKRLDVYELSAGVIRSARGRLGRERFAIPGLGRRARFIRADLNFVCLPKNRYDVIWSSGCLHHILDLEHLFAEVEQALCDGGLFALHDYVGERRQQYAPHRLERINELLSEVPPRFRRGGVETIAAPSPDTLSPFCGVRSDDILPVARARFEVVHQAVTGALFPLFLYLDLPAMRRQAPELLDRLMRAESEAERVPGMGAGAAYAVFRRRASP